MDIPYIDKYGQLWNTSGTEMPFSPLMQTMPTTIIPESANAEPMYFRPRNHFTDHPISLEIEADKPRISAFKPVIRRQESYDSESSSYSVSQLLNLSPSNSCSSLGSSYVQPLYDSWNHSGFQLSPTIDHTPNVNDTNIFYENFRKSNEIAMMSQQNDCNVEQIPENPPIAYQQYNYAGNINTNAHHANGYNCNTSFSPNVSKEPLNLVQSKKIDTQIRQNNVKFQTESSETDVPIIDLTASEDVEQPVFEEKVLHPMIKPKRTPPLDINGNEILITTDTKTMQVISYTKTTDKTTAKIQGEIPTHTNQDDPSISFQNTIYQTVPSASSMEKYSKQMLSMNMGRRNGHRMPPKEQMKFAAKYNRWLHENHMRNGFRLFACHNSELAQKYASKSNSIVNLQNILWYWWNSVTPSEQEEYAKNAYLLKKKSQSKKNEMTKEKIQSVLRDDNHKGKKQTNKKSEHAVDFGSTGLSSDAVINLSRTIQ